MSFYIPTGNGTQLSPILGIRLATQMRWRVTDEENRFETCRSLWNLDRKSISLSWFRNRMSRIGFGLFGFATKTCNVKIGASAFLDLTLPELFIGDLTWAQCYKNLNGHNLQIFVIG